MTPHPSQPYVDPISKWWMQPDESGASPLRPATEEEVRIARRQAGLTPDPVVRTASKGAICSLVMVVLLLVLLIVWMFRGLT